LSALQAQSPFLWSFMKGSVFSLLLIIVFALWAYMRGTAYEESVLSSLPSIVIPVSHSEETISEHHVAETHPVAGTTDTDHMEAAHHDEAPEHGEAAGHHQDVHTDVTIYDEGLVEESQFGLLPQKDVTNGNTPFRQYKRNFILPAGQHKFRLVLGPLGFSEEFATKIAHGLPQDVTILISPYSDHADALMRLFKESGHEVWLQLPAETHDEYTMDAGSLALRASYARNKNLSLYKRVMGRTTGYVGLFINHADNSTLSFSSARMEELQTDIYQRGLGLAYFADKPMTDIEKISTEHNGQTRLVSYQFDTIFSDGQRKLDGIDE
jgi:polysaccharide deacetylase 2 family uncharacterized protein YibQ